jgi:hypothetical protein
MRHVTDPPPESGAKSAQKRRAPSRSLRRSTTQDALKKANLIALHPHSGRVAVLMRDGLRKGRSVKTAHMVRRRPG